MSEKMKDYEKELEASLKKVQEGDILTGTVISVDEKEVVLDMRYYAEGIIPAEDYSREPGFNLKEDVHVGDEVSATVVPVSYTHLDVYKRQLSMRSARSFLAK